MITFDRWHQIKELFCDALEIAPQDRPDFLDARCADDRDLRTQVEALLTSRARAGVFLEGSAAVDFDSMSDALAASLVGQRLGRYQIKGLIGRGGMGIVYLAERDSPPRKVALKILNPALTSARMLWRFAHEALVLDRLQHPGIARIFEPGTAETEHGQQPFVVMEFVDGLPLADYVHRRLSIGQRLELVAKIADAVQYAHMKGVIHRDLKPGNILVDKTGQPKILDFGIARLTDADVRPTTFQTHEGQLLGTIYYMSPEQVTGDPHGIDTRCDIYALGVIGYEMLSGHLPHDLQHRTVPEAIRIICEQDIIPLGSVDRNFRGDVETIFTKALAKDRTARYQTASDLAADIRRYLQREPISARPPSAVYQLRKMIVRHKLPLVLAVILLVALVSFTTTLMIQSRELLGQRDIAITAEQLAEQRLQAMAAARQETEMEARKAERISAFLQDMLASADPANQNRDITVREVLDDAARRLETDLKEHPEVDMAIRSTLAATYESLGQYDAAESQLHKVVALKEQVYGDRHLEVAESLNRLAALLSAKADYAQAESLYRRALTIRRDLLGDEHPNLTKTLNELATLFHRQGDREAAEPVVEEALRIYRRMLDEQHALLDVDLSGLAAHLCMQKKYDDALALYRDTLRMRRQLLGNEHPLVSEDLTHLASLLHGLGHYKEAESRYQEALVLQRGLYGEKHVGIANTLAGLAYVLRSAGHLDEAVSLARESLNMRRELLGNEHPDVAQSVYSLASLLDTRGQTEAAEALYREALVIRLKLSGAQHPDVAFCRAQLGRFLHLKGEHQEAEPLLRKALKVRREVLSEGNWRIAYLESDLGSCLKELGRHQQAEPLLLSGYSLIHAKRGPQHKRTLEALDRIIELYDSWDRPQQAAEYRALLRTKSDAS